MKPSRSHGHRSRSVMERKPKLVERKDVGKNNVKKKTADATDAKKNVKIVEKDVKKKDATDASE